MTRYLIVGNSAGGIGAAEAIRELDRSGEVSLVSDEPHHTYSRPAISEYLAGSMELESMFYRPADFYARNGLRALLGKRVVKVDAAAHQVELDDGSHLPWDRLLLATGGVPFVPPIEGLDKQGVFTFTRMDDARGLRERALRAGRAVVIGGGLIGMSVAEALVRRGAQVTVVELKDRILNLILDETGSRLAEEVLRQASVQVITGKTVSAVRGRFSRPSEVGSVVLSDGREMPCDLVAVAIGVVPRTELAREAGLALRRGVVVDRHMATSVPHIYACGDVAEAYDYVYGENRLTPIWPNAYLGGRTAGRNMAGVSTHYPGGTAMNSLKYFGLPIISGGLVNTDQGDGYAVLRRLDEARGVYRKLVLREGRLVGMIFAGDIQGAGVAHGLMRRGTHVDDFQEAILGEGFDLIALPAPLRQELLAAAVPGPA